MKINFDLYSPQTLRDAIEYELLSTDDAKMAATIAIKRLNKDPNYYDRCGIMQKASKPTKYVSRKKVKGKWIYTYTDKKESKPKIWIEKIGNFFNLKTYVDISDKIESDYKENNIEEKHHVSFRSWKDHLAEYFNHKEKWDSFFSGKKKTEPKPKKEKKETKVKDKKESKKKGLKLSIMKEIFGLYGKKKKEEPIDNFDTMPDKEEEIKEETKKENEDIKDKLKKIETGEGSKIETNVKITEKQEKEQIKSDEIEAREGYFNEKPSEILNVGNDVWGAARHNYDTYEKASVDISEMEKDGTATAYVTKKNIIGKYSLNDEETKERVKNGETESKVLASFAVREYLEKIPADDELSRKEFMAFSRALTRLDDNTKTSKDFLVGLSEEFQNIFNVDVGERNALGKSSKVVGYSLSAFFSLLMNPQDSRARSRVSFGADSKDRKKITNLTNIIVMESGGQKGYNEIKVDVLGATKASGVKIKKGDSIVFKDNLKDQVYVIESQYASEEDKLLAQKARDNYIDLKYNLKIPSEFHKMREKNQEDYKRKWSDYFGYSVNSLEEAKIAKEKGIREAREILSSKESRVRLYPKNNGQVIKVGKKKIDVSFEFPNGKIKTFRVDPSQIKQENVESIKKERTKKKTGKVNLYIESQVKRKGGKDYSNLSVQNAQELLKKEYGFKALQYGNSMPEDERDYHTKWSLQAFSDLSEVLNIPIKQITVNGKLGMAFGARGKGFIGGNGIVAHYESGSKMINLTRGSGFGSLAHEWGHFLDNILTKDMQGFISYGNSFKEQIVNKNTIKNGSILERPKRRGKGTDRFYFDENAKNPDYPFAKLDSGLNRPKEGSQYYNFYDFRSGKDVKVKEENNKPFMNKAQEIAVLAKKDFEKKIEDASPDLKALFQDKIRYWGDPIECFARSFECYISDKLEDNGRKNTYLASKDKTEKKDGSIVYPQGENRKEINSMFDEFFNMIRDSEDLKKAIIRFENGEYYRIKK